MIRLPLVVAGTLFLIGVILFTPAESLFAQPPLPAPSAFDNVPQDSEPTFDDPEQIQGLISPEAEEIPWNEVIKELVIALFPDAMEGDDNWGDQTTIVAGLRFRDGRLMPREHEVNHGFWQRYSFSLLNPEETLQIWIDESSSPEPGVFDFRWRVQLRGRCRTQVAHWTFGVKGFNTSTESDVTLRARIACRLELKPTFDTETLRPGMTVCLQLSDLELRLRDIDTRRIGVIGGWVAREMGDGQRRFIEAILRSQEDRIRRRIQEEIDEEL